MSALALTLVLTAAIIHASWNLLAKRATGGIAFIWPLSVCAMLIYTPLVAGYFLRYSPDLGLRQLAFMVTSGFLQMAYFWALDRAYRSGDMSLVYPLARGTGPMLATLGAILFLGERPTFLALIGIALIGLGVFLFAGGMSRLDHTQAIGYALLTGTIIATYTLVDKYAVAVVKIHPLLYDWFSNTMRTLILLPLAWQRRQHVLEKWRAHRREIIGVAILSPLAYILILAALTFNPVSHIAPLRETSILIGAAMGTLILKEKDAQRRWPAAGIVVAGVVMLAIS